MRTLAVFAVVSLSLLTGSALATPDVAAKLQPIVVMVMTDGGQGSGVVDGNHIWTAAHVVDAAKTVEVKTFGGIVTPVTVVAMDRDADIALLKLPKEVCFPSLKWAKSDPRIATPIYCCGCPAGDGWTVSRGVVSFVGRKLGGQVYDQIDCPIFYGSSGGGAFDASSGEFVGLTVAMRHPTHGFIVPARVIREFCLKHVCKGFGL